MTHVYKIHKRDPNFPATIINKIEEFLSKPNMTATRRNRLISVSSFQTTMMSSRTLTSMSKSLPR